jgi:hypothetical protein
MVDVAFPFAVEQLELALGRGLVRIDNLQSVGWDAAPSARVPPMRSRWDGGTRRFATASHPTGWTIEPAMIRCFEAMGVASSGPSHAETMKKLQCISDNARSQMIHLCQDPGENHRRK